MKAAWLCVGGWAGTVCPVPSQGQSQGRSWECGAGRCCVPLASAARSPQRSWLCCAPLLPPRLCLGFLGQGAKGSQGSRAQTPALLLLERVALALLPSEPPALGQHVGTVCPGLSGAHVTLWVWCLAFEAFVDPVPGFPRGAGKHSPSVQGADPWLCHSGIDGRL